MAPPAKRRRRNAAAEHSSDNDDDDEQPPQATNTLANFLSPNKNHSQNRAPTASPSPLKSKPTRKSTTSNGLPRRAAPSSPSPKKSKTFDKGDEKGKSADLKTLFSKQAQRPKKQPTASVPLDDIISDPISEDDISELKVSSSSLVGQHAKKRTRDGTQPASNGILTSSQRFLKPPKPPSPDGLDDDQRPWSERFGPRNLDELVVHKKKVADVKKWLEDVIAGRLRQRLLILKGPAGSAKTTTLRLLANDMGVEVLEWKNPANNIASGLVSASAKFDEFLGRAGKFGALDMEDEPSPTPTSTPLNDNGKRLMLVEEFPNTFSRSSSALSSFRSSLLSYLATHVPSLSMFTPHSKKEPIKPVVLVISETLLTTTSASADSFTAHRLLGPEILRHPGVNVIEFNAVAPTLLAKALEIIVQKEARKSGRKKTPGPLVLQRLGEIGDVRSAISSLEFLCLKGDQEADWGAQVAFNKKKKPAKGSIGMTKGEADSLELISQREASLGIFHAVGKVVYNKRDAAPVDDDVENLPPHLSAYSRPKRSQVSVESLIDETGTDTHTFISALHENYALSCENIDPMDVSTPIDYINECIEALSQSDLLCPSRDVFFGGRGGFAGKDSGSHLLRQDEITFQAAVRGMLFSLPNPVHRKVATGARGTDAFKMFYPQSLKLWRAKEEIEGLVDMWSSKLLKGEVNGATKNLTDGASAYRKPVQSAPETSWMARQQQHKAPARSDSQDKDDDSAPLLSLGSAARREMLLERLPYMAHIARAKGGKSAIRPRDLDKVVTFKGIHPTDDESDAEGDEQATQGEAWATDKPTEEMSPRKKSAGVKSGAMSGMLAQKLVLSDDDIED